MNIILATRNPGKAAQIRSLFAGSGITLLSMADMDIEGEAVEDGTTFRANAFKKALYVYERVPLGHWVMADDTGLCIDALGGEPGVQTRYWAGPDASDMELQAHALERMRTHTNRNACFQTVVAVLDPEQMAEAFHGSLFGHLFDEPRPITEPGLPFSPIFVPQGMSLTLSELSADEQNRISHRGKAFAQAIKFLQGMQQQVG